MEIKLIEWFDDHWYKIILEDESSLHVASVSTKLGIISKPFLARWRGDIGNEAADKKLFESSHRGSRIHDGWNRLSTGGIVLYNPLEHKQYQPGEVQSLSDTVDGNLSIVEHQDEAYDLYKLWRWLKEVKPNIIASEQTVAQLVMNEAGGFSPILSDAGTLDNIFDIDGGSYQVAGAKDLFIPKGRYIVDLKSGKNIGDVKKQLAAYKKCAESQGYGPIDGAICIHTQASTKGGIKGLTTYLYSPEELERQYELYRHAAALWEGENASKRANVFEFPSILTLDPAIQYPEIDKKGE